MVQYSYLDTPIGILTVYAVEGGVVYISLPGSNAAVAKNWSEKVLGETEFIESDIWLIHVKSELNEYFSGQRKSFSCDHLLFTSPFRKKSLEAVLQIPYGKKQSYAKIANNAGNARAVRAAGSANATNPLPILIPCHRVISSDGSLGGYGGGLQMKQWLLDHESSYYSS
jgi:methylated-DNA-[protein]-cysteine S-methyltransferase